MSNTCCRGKSATHVTGGKLATQFAGTKSATHEVATYVAEPHKPKVTA